MTWLLALIPWEWVAAFGAGVIALAASWLGGRMSGKTAAKLNAAKQHIKTRERMDDATRDLPDDTDQLREWLRKRGDKR